MIPQNYNNFSNYVKITLKAHVRNFYFKEQFFFDHILYFGLHHSFFALTITDNVLSGFGALLLRLMIGMQPD